MAWTRAIAYALKCGLIVTLASVLAGRDWLLGVTAGGALAAAFIPQILKRAGGTAPAPAYDLALVTLLSAHVYGHTLGLYNQFRHYDVILHALAASALGVAAYHALRWAARARLRAELPRGAAGALAVAVALALGVAWEIIEFAVDHALHLNNQQSNADTMRDLLADFAGAATGASLAPRAPALLVGPARAPRCASN